MLQVPLSSISFTSSYWKKCAFSISGLAGFAAHLTACCLRWQQIQAHRYTQIKHYDATFGGVKVGSCQLVLADDCSEAAEEEAKVPSLDGSAAEEEAEAPSLDGSAAEDSRQWVAGFVTNLHQLADIIENDIFIRIETQYAHRLSSSNAHDSNVRKASQFEIRILERSNIHLLQETALKQLEQCRHNQQLTQLVGPSGVGKSTLLATYCQEKRYDMVTVASYFCGKSSGKTDPWHMVYMFCEQLSVFTTCEDSQVPPSMSYQGLCEHFQNLLATVATTQTEVLVVCDAVNELNTDLEYALRWIPEAIPSNCHIMLSNTQSKQLPPMLQLHTDAEVAVELLLPKSRIELVSQLLRQHGKQLSDDQMQCLITKKDAGSALFLNLVCEELRLFGQFELVTAEIRGYPDSIEDMYRRVLERLETDHDPEAVRRACICIVQADGLYEEEVVQVITTNAHNLQRGASQTKECFYKEILLFAWPGIYRSAASLFQPRQDVGAECVKLTHMQVRTAIEERYPYLHSLFNTTVSVDF